MGTWGTGLYANDCACDVRDIYTECLQNQLSNEEAYKETLKNIKDPNYKNLVYVSNDEVVALDEIIRFFGDDLFLIFEELKHSYCDYMSLMSQGVCPNYHKFIDDKVNRVLKHIDVYTKRIG